MTQLPMVPDGTLADCETESVLGLLIYLHYPVTATNQLPTT